MKVYCTVVLMLFLNSTAKAQSTNPVVLEVLVGVDRPPYVLEKMTTGFELELLDKVFVQMGFQLDYLFVPNSRTPQFIKRRAFDVVTTVNEDFGTDKQHHTKPYIIYHNYVVSLAANNLTIDTIVDLAELRIGAFQAASLVLGEAFRKVTDKNNSYLEIASQLTKIEMLYKGRLDAIIIDKNLFNYLSNKHGHKAKVRFHNLFEQTEYSLWMKNKELIPIFNRTFETFKMTETYRQLKTDYNVADQYQ